MIEKNRSPSPGRRPRSGAATPKNGPRPRGRRSLRSSATWGIARIRRISSASMPHVQGGGRAARPAQRLALGPLAEPARDGVEEKGALGDPVRAGLDQLVDLPRPEVHEEPLRRHERAALPVDLVEPGTVN